MVLFSLLVRTSAAACGEAAADEAGAAEVHTLYAANEADTAARASGDAQAIKRDDARVKEARKLDAAGKVCTPAAKMEAAWLLLQGDDVATLQRSYDLAVEAMQGREPRAASVVPTAFDALRVAQGAPQRYATQLSTSAAGKRCLVAMEGELPEAERATYRLGPAKDVYKKLLVESGFPDDEPTLERLDRRGLLCPPTAARR